MLTDVLPSQYPEVQAYPNLKRILQDYIDVQFSDLRTILKLPMPSRGLVAGCNFTAAAVLFNIVGGASVCFYDADPPTWGDRGDRFQDLLTNYYPWPGDDCYPIAKCVEMLYKVARNPLTHSFGIGDPSANDLVLAKKELAWPRVRQLEDSVRRPIWVKPTLYPSTEPKYKGKTALSVPTLYWGVHRMLHGLFADSAQVGKAEAFAARIT